MNRPGGSPAAFPPVPAFLKPLAERLLGRAPETAVETVDAALAAAACQEVGAELARRRSSRGIALEAAAAATRIRRRHLAALERGDLAALPGETYSRGYLRTYAGFLGLEGERLVARLPRGRRGELVSGLTGERSPWARLVLTRPLLAGTALLLLVLAFTAYVGHQLDSVRSDSPPTPSPAQSIPLASPPASPLAGPVRPAQT